MAGLRRRLIDRRQGGWMEGSTLCCGFFALGRMLSRVVGCDSLNI